MFLASRAFRMAPVVLVVGLVLGAGCGGGGSKKTVAPQPITTIPAGWGGVWSVRTQVGVCNTTSVLFDSTLVDTLCPGTSIGDLIGLGDGLCANASLTGTGNTVSYSCTDTLSVQGCSGTLSVGVTATVNPTAGTSSGSGRIQFTAQPATSGCSDFCIDITQAGTRIAPTPAQCSPTLWGFFRAVRLSRAGWGPARR